MIKTKAPQFLFKEKERLFWFQINGLVFIITVIVFFN